MNEADTRVELIDPKLKESGWGIDEGTKIHREFSIAPGRIPGKGEQRKPLKADYVLEYKGRKLAVVEAKSDKKDVGEGVGQAKEYARKLHIDITYATNGKEIYQICFKTGEEQLVNYFATPEDLWNRSFSKHEVWKEKFSQVAPEERYRPWYFQEIAINKTLDAIAEDKKRILLTLATGTGKTPIALQIAWKLFHARWNLKKDGNRQPRILFLTDRNILANQAFNKFSGFPEDALVRIRTTDIKKRGAVPTNGSIFFTIFQTFMSGPNNTPYFGQYPKDYFDVIFIDECHRGGANDEGNWRGILEYFSPAVQIGLTATPKRKENADTYKYFGNPLYSYSLKEGINDGFLTPFKVKRVKTTMDEYFYTPDDEIIEGEVEVGKIYKEADFNKIIEIKAREAKRVRILLKDINQNEKTIVFCATQDHAAAVRDLINQFKDSKDPGYCERVTANDGKLGENHLENFQDNEKTIPTILTTSQKLSTGVDATNIRNIVLLRPINSMIEFKQIIGRGTRLFDQKNYFTIFDFVGAYHHFNDPEWDGEPIDPEVSLSKNESEDEKPLSVAKHFDKPKRLKIKLRDGKEREIQYMISTSYWAADGKPVSSEQFLKNINGELPNFFTSEEQLRNIWESPITRKAFLIKLADAGYGFDQLKELQKIIFAEKSDLFDVLAYIAFALKPITREQRVAKAQHHIFELLDNRQKEFLEFVLSKYIDVGIEELDQEKLPELLKIKYDELSDATEKLGDVNTIKEMFIGFQKHLYATIGKSNT